MEKNSAVKFSPLGMTGEIGEILPLVKISRYPVLPLKGANYGEEQNSFGIPDACFWRHTSWSEHNHKQITVVNPRDKMIIKVAVCFCFPSHKMFNSLAT